MIRGNAVPVGLQEKYYADSKYFKHDDEASRSYYGASEIISYKIAQILEIEEHLCYWLERCGDRVVCVSNDFSLGYERQMSLWDYAPEDLQSLSENTTFCEFERNVSKLAELMHRTVYQFMRLLWDDLINLNIDRHFGNLTVMFDNEGVTASPFYDYGQSWLVSYVHVSDENVDALIRQCVFEPFGLSYETALDWYSRICPMPYAVGKITARDIAMLLDECLLFYPTEYIESRQLVIMHQLEILGGL